jgi:DNA-binding beta-propeller fold protein YncE
MTAHQTIKSTPDRARTGKLFVLELNAGRIHVFNADGSGKTTIVEGARNPDGIAVDVEAGHIYWTNMGNPKANDGSIERADLDGGNRVTIVPPGGTFTPKQMQLEKTGGKLYWSDREGMRVMRANLDGSDIETLIQTGDAGTRPGPDAARWCVGIAVDPVAGKFYWTQKGPDNGEVGLLCRANIAFPPGQDAADRADIEVLLDHLPEPIDLEIDEGDRILYWTDRGNPPRGNTVNRIGVDARPGEASPEIVFSDLMEAIGIALDRAGGHMFVTDLTGSIYTARLDGSDRRPLAMAQGNLTGIAYAELPTEK